MSSYLDAELTGAERHRMERHIGACEQCRRLLAGLRATVDALGQLSVPIERVDPVRLAASVRIRIQQPPGR
jgi:anti-sigma factor RsiW